MPEERLSAIRKRIEKKYVFDQPGDVVVSQDDDMAWLVNRVIELICEVKAIKSLLGSGKAREE